MAGQMLRVDGDLLVTGLGKFGNLVVPANSIGNEAVNPASPIAATKLDHQFVLYYAQNRAAAVAAERKAIHICWGLTGGVVGFQVALTQACVGDSTITVDLYKNGASVLSSTITIDSTNAGFELVEGTLSDTTIEADDVFEVVVTVSAGTGTLGRGIIAQLVTREKAD